MVHNSKQRLVLRANCNLQSPGYLSSSASLASTLVCHLADSADCCERPAAAPHRHQAHTVLQLLLSQRATEDPLWSLSIWTLRCVPSSSKYSLVTGRVWCCTDWRQV